MKIIFGFKFEAEDTLHRISEAFSNKGIDAELVQRNLKSSVEKQLYTNPDTAVIIMDEYLESTSPYSAEDILRLVEMNEKVLIIPVISEKHKGDEYVVKLHNMGIFNAVYSNINIEQIAGLIIAPRTRVAARIYYGISSEESIKDMERTNIPRLIGYVDSMEDDEEKIIDAVEYIRKRLSDTDFALFCERLNDRHIEILWSHGLYAEFIGYRMERKKKVPAININFGGVGGREKEKVVYKEIGNDVTAVVSPRRKSGCTFVSINIAKAVADATGLVSGFLHLPDGGRTFTALNLNKYIKNYKSGLQEIKDNLIMTSMANVISRVSILCENPETDVLDDWDTSDSLRVMYQAPNPTILDFGFLKSEELKLLSECKRVVVVIDENCSIDEFVDFRNNVLGILDNTGIYYIFNRINEGDERELRQYINGEENCFMLAQCKHGRNQIYCNDKFFTDLAGNMGFSGGSVNIAEVFRGKVRNIIKKLIEKKRVVGVATVEIAVVGVAHGAGCTHTAIMIAASLAKKYRVAYLEANPSGHMKCLDSQINKEVIIGDIKGFSYCGIDFYHDIEYTEFTSLARDRYSFVVVDYGTDITRAEYQRAGKRVVVMAAADYRMQEMDRFVTDVLGHIDKAGLVSIAVPFKNNRELAVIRKLCSENTVYSVPFCSNPFNVTEEVKEYVGRIVGV